MTKTVKSISGGALVFFLYACLRNVIPLHNMVFFMVGALLFIAVTLLLQGILPEESKVPESVDKLLTLLIPAGIALWLFLYYVHEQDAPDPIKASKMVRGTFPNPVWMGIMLLGTGIVLLLLSRKAGERKKWQQIFKSMISILFTIIVSAQFYAPNIYQDTLGNVFHSHSYTNSIIQILWLTPYSHSMTTNYGHYALLYLPFVKLLHRLFGIDYLTGIYLITAVIAGIAILAFLYVLHYFAKRDLIYYLGMLGIGEYYFMLMRGGVYLQVHPHRIIFPALILALALYEKKKEKHHNGLMIGILSLSMVWSTEIGIVLLLAVTAYRWFEKVADQKKFSLKKLFSVFKEALLYAGIPFALAYLIVQFYNRFLAANGHWLSFADYMFPLISEKDYISYIELPLSDEWHAWVGTGILFLVCVCLSVLPLFFSMTVRKEQEYLFLLAVMGLGEMQYYVNRPAEGCMFIVMFHVLILLVVILEKSQNIYWEWKEEKQKSPKALVWSQNRILYLTLRVLAVLLLFIAASDSVYHMPGAIQTSKDSIWKRQELQEFAHYVWEQVPPDAKAFGMGVPELLSMVDRDDHLHTTDYAYPNMAFDVLLDVRNDLEDEPWFFCLMQSLQEMEMNYPGLTDHFEVHEIMSYNGRDFGFFVRKEE